MMKIFKRVLDVLSTVILVLLIAVVIVVFIARVNNQAPSVFGYKIFRVTTGSMEPTLKIGDVILDKEVEPDEIRVGDIITYFGTEGDLKDKYITHEVKEIYQNEGRRYKFITQGQVKGAVEDPEVDESQIQGVFVLKVPVLNSLYTFFLSEYGLMVFVAFIVVLFSYEIISIIVSYQKEKMIENGEIELDADENIKK